MRPILHPSKASGFSKYYNDTYPHDGRHLTDIDGLEFDGVHVTGLIEHRTGGYVGGHNDNRGLLALRRLAVVLGLKWPEVEICRALRPGEYDTHHLLWLSYLKDTEYSPPRMLAMFHTPGNRSPSQCRTLVNPLVLDPLKKLLEGRVMFREIPVRADGRPVSPANADWLAKLAPRFER